MPRHASRTWTALGIAASVLCAAPSTRATDWVEQRRAMVASLQEAGIQDERVLWAMGIVPRERFAPVTFRDHAYAPDAAMPLACPTTESTLSRPLTVALMTALLTLEPGDRVLEVGTGSGYQAAVLAQILRRLGHSARTPRSGHVDTVELDADLQRTAQGLLRRLGYGNVTCHHGDGAQGLATHGSFNKILVTAAVDDRSVIASLSGQLVEGGRIVAPLQDGIIRGRRDRGLVTWQDVAPANFVPLVRPTSPATTASRARRSR